MDKQALIQCIIQRLEQELDNAMQAAQRAHDTATHEENIPENKYDTLSLEAAYLAEGQSRRVEQLKQELLAFKNMQDVEADEDSQISIGHFVTLLRSDAEGETGEETEMHLFIGPSAGGLQISDPVNQLDCVVLTAEAPLGKAVIGRYIDDDFTLALGGKAATYVIEAVC